MADECARCPKPGMCCEFLELQLASPLSGDQMKWVALHDGVSIVERNDATFVHIDVICGALTQEGTCALHGTPDRPRMCEGWPYGDPVKHQAPEGCIFLEEVRNPRLIPVTLTT